MKQWEIWLIALQNRWYARPFEGVENQRVNSIRVIDYTEYEKQEKQIQEMKQWLELTTEELRLERLKY